MKKLFIFIAVLSIVLLNCNVIYAADGYSFELQYEGAIVKNEEKDANVLLVGINGPAHTNVLIKVDIEGPATPKLLAYDSTGTEYDIAQIGSWGPPSGFAVQGTFENKTPIRATFPEEGTYKITLSLLDLTNSNNVITSKTIELEVYEDVVGEVNEIGNSIVENNVIEELPKTGTSILDYVIYTSIILCLISMFVIYINRKKINV